MKTCPKCTGQWPDSERFCLECGTPLPDALPVSAPTASGKSSNKKLVLVLVSILVAVTWAAGGVIAVLLLSGDSSGEHSGKQPSDVEDTDEDSQDGGETQPSLPAYATLFRDGKLYRVEFDTYKEMLITDQTGDWNGEMIYGVVATPDSRYVLFPGPATKGEESTDLRLRSLENLEEPYVVVDTKVSEYVVSTNSDTVLYLREDGEFYRYSISAGSRELIHSNVSNYQCSPDCQDIIFRVVEDPDTWQSSHYRIVDGNFGNIMLMPKARSSWYSDDLSLLLYIESEETPGYSQRLYRLDEQGNSTYIDDNVERVWEFDNHTYYYLKVTSGMRFADLLVDDSGDRRIYDTILNTLESYSSAQVYDLYYYDGHDSVRLAAGILDAQNISNQRGAMMYQYAGSGVSVSVSELAAQFDITYDAYEMIEFILDNHCSYGIVVDQRIFELPLTNVWDASFNEEMTRLAVVANWDDEEYFGDIYLLEYNGTSLGEARLLAHEADDAQFQGDELFYLSNGDLYVGSQSERVAKDALGTAYMPDGDLILVGYNADEDKETYSLGLYQNGQVINIIDGLENIYPLGGGVVLLHKPDDWYGYYYRGQVKEIAESLEDICEFRFGGPGEIYLYWPE